MTTPPSPAADPAPAARRGVVAAVVGLTALLFLLDIHTPVGMATWLAYLAAVLLALAVPGRRTVLSVTLAVSLLTVASYYLSPAGGDPDRAAVNRGLGIAVFWAAAVGGLSLRRTADLERANARLVREVGERRRAEERVREHASLLDIARDAITVRDLDDRITYWNRGAEALYGWTAAEAVGRPAAELFDPSPPAEREAVHRALLARGAWDGEVRHVTRAGREVVVDTRCTLVRDDAGRPRAKLVVDTDVTERWRLEGHVRRGQRLESVGVLAGGLAHDFNNLLTPILMSAKLLREDRPADERAGLVDTLQAAAERGAELVRKLLAFAGGAEGGPAAADVPAAVAEVRGIVAHTFPKGIELDMRLADDLPPAAADPTGLAQVLMNLCVNARDAMPAGGRLGVEAAAAELPAGDPALPPDAAPGRYVRLTVTDTGTGIAPDVLDRIFDPFFTTKGPGRGTGLGLATVAGIVRGHGGFVAVASTPGAGSRFDVYWPVADRSAAAAADPPAAPPVGTGGRPLVLVVDDEPPILATARTVLEAAGCRVATAADGAAALAVYRRERPAVRAVVLDAMMPGMDGAATLAELDRIDPGCRVVVTSGRRPAGPLAEAVRAGRAGFLPKPYTAAQLLAALAGSVPA